MAATGPETGLTSISLGVVRALDRRGIRVGFCKPITQNRIHEGEPEPSSHFIEKTMNMIPPTPIPLKQAEEYLSKAKTDDLMELVVSKIDQAAKNADVVVVEGLLPTEGESFKNRLNRTMVSNLNAEVILVAAYEQKKVEELENKLRVTATLYGGIQSEQVIGCILNKVNFGYTLKQPQLSSLLTTEDRPAQEFVDPTNEEVEEFNDRVRKECPLFEDHSFVLFGSVPLNQSLTSYRTIDVARHLNATIINEGDMTQRRVTSVALCARYVTAILHLFKPGTLILAPADRNDIMMASALAALNDVPLAGVLLTGDTNTDHKMMDFCRKSFATGLPIISVPTDSYQTANALGDVNPEVPSDDIERMNHVMDFVARQIGGKLLEKRCKSDLELRMSPAAFRYDLANKARQANKRIILPEGDEPRTIQAAVACQERDIAQCVLLGDPDEIKRIAQANGISLPDSIELIDIANVRSRYIPHLMEMRKHKNLTEDQCREALEDNVMLGTVMLALNEVDGLVSGAVHSSANTIRPALQIIKTRPGNKVVSSIFFMCFPDSVLVYGDCAVNPDPDAETLADIAIQSADSAARFGIPPKVALISYSTGESGTGADVEKVRKATQLAQEKRPDLLIDGPLQYDAAAIKDVAKKKAPDSPIAGQATVFIFPDLNTGNTTYKAVQRSANLVSIGPMLQGLKKPVNDLSRGALVDDIIYTIALTAIQAGE
ncbi:MAG: phosphate acetyltransferase [Verrucomicrobiota bacterium]